MREALAVCGQFGQIARSLRLIHTSYARSLDVSQLAEEAGMGVSSFHNHFKAITQVSPMQYVKSTRLHQARLLMVRQGLSADTASHAVGYTSASQFSREFKRLFGLTPAAETRRMRENFALPAFADATNCRRTEPQMFNSDIHRAYEALCRRRGRAQANCLGVRTMPAGVQIQTVMFVGSVSAVVETCGSQSTESLSTSAPWSVIFRQVRNC